MGVKEQRSGYIDTWLKLRLELRGKITETRIDTRGMNNLGCCRAWFGCLSRRYYAPAGTNAGLLESGLELELPVPVVVLLCNQR